MTSVDVRPASGWRPGADASFQDRLVEGLAEAIRKHGLQETTIADIVGFARTSRRTFYELFSSKDDCFVALMRRENKRIAEAIVTAVDPHASWDQQVAQAIEAWILTQAAEPELNLSWIREMPVLGSGTREIEREFLDGMVGLIHALVDTEELRSVGVLPPSRELTVILLGGLSALFAMTIEGGGDVRHIVAPCIEATVALLGPRA